MIVEIVPNPYQKKTLHCSVGDTGLRKFTFELFNNGVLLENLSNVSLVCENGEFPLREDDGWICDCTELLTSQEGLFPCKIKVESNEGVIYSEVFNLHCEVKP